MSQHEPTVAERQQSIDAYIETLSEEHRLHRKIQFLLDVRGLLIINHLAGDYVEFGVYRGEMMYAAAKVLSPHIGKYVGLDTFEGLPEPHESDSEVFVFESKGFMAAPQNVSEMMMKDFNLALVEGDFRQEDVQARFRSEISKISVMVLDCNWPSSVRAALSASAPFLQCGSVIFHDDYFVGAHLPNFNRRIMDEVAERSGLRFVEFKTYPPCARAFIVEE